MKEVWKDLVGYEGHYQVSNFGKIKSVGRYGFRPASRRNKSYRFWIRERILKTGINGGGYKYVILSVGHHLRPLTIHKAVAVTFLGERPLGMAIDHIDGNKLNNRADNLEYVTPKENSRRAILTGCVGIGVNNSHCTIKSRVIELEIIRLRYEEKWTYKEIANKFNIRRGAVYRCLLRNNAYKNIGRVGRPRGPYKKHRD